MALPEVRAGGRGDARLQVTTTKRAINFPLKKKKKKKKKKSTVKPYYKKRRKLKLFLTITTEHQYTN